MRRIELGAMIVATVLTSGCPADDTPINETITATDSGTGGDDTGEPATTGADETGVDTAFPGDPMTFYIEETIDFTNSNLAACNNTDLNQVGVFLQLELEDRGFVGTYTLDEDGTPYNFVDPNLGMAGAGGQDGAASDANRISVYAGHGFINSMQWGNPGPTPAGAPGPACNVTIDDEMRLGTLAGDTSAFAMYVTSCTANTANNNLINTLGQSQIGQHVGWHNSPAVGDQTPAAFVAQTATSIVDGDVSVPVTNLDAWLGIAQSKPGFGENSPVIFTPGATDDEVVDRHFNARLALGIGLEDVIPEPQDPNTFNFSWVDNGDCP